MKPPLIIGLDKSGARDKDFHSLKFWNQAVRGLAIGENEEAESILSLWCSKTVMNTREVEAEVSENWCGIGLLKCG